MIEEAADEKKLVLQPEEEEREGQFKLPKPKEPAADQLPKDEREIEVEEHAIKLERKKSDVSEESEPVKIKPARKKSKPKITEEAADEKKLVLQREEEGEQPESSFKLKKPRKSVDEQAAKPEEQPTESHDIKLEKIESKEETSTESVKIKPKRKKSKPEVVEEAADEKKLILQPEEEDQESKFKLPKRKEPVSDVLAKEETTVEIEEHSIKLEKSRVESREETSEESVKIKPKRKKSKPEVVEEAADEKKLILQPEEEDQESKFKLPKRKEPAADQLPKDEREIEVEEHAVKLEKARVESKEETSEESVKIKPKRKKSKPEVVEEAADEKKLILQPEEEDQESKFKLPKRKEPVSDVLAKDETTVEIEEHSIKLEKTRVESREESSTESIKIKPKRKKSKPEQIEEASDEKKLIIQPEEEDREGKFKLPKAPKPVSEELAKGDEDQQPTETYDVRVERKAKISEVEEEADEVSLKKKPKKAAPSYSEQTEEVEEKVVLKGPETRRKSSIKQTDVEIKRHTVDEQSSEILIRKKSSKKKVVFEDSDELSVKRKESKKSKTTTYSTQEESVESKIIIRDEESEQQWIDGEQIDEEEEDIQFKMKKPRRESFATLETRKLSIEDNQIGINIKKKMRKQSSEESAELNLKRESRRSSTTSVQSHDLGGCSEQLLKVSKMTNGY